MIEIILIEILLAFGFGFILGGIFMMVLMKSHCEEKIQKLWESWEEDESDRE